MKRLYTCALTSLFLFFLALAFEPRAMAYVDPGSGLLLTQTIGAFCAATAFWFRRQLRQLFRSRSKDLEVSKPAE